MTSQFYLCHFSQYTLFQCSFPEYLDISVYDILIYSCLTVAFSKLELCSNIVYIAVGM